MKIYEITKIPKTNQDLIELLRDLQKEYGFFNKQELNDYLTYCESPEEIAKSIRGFFKTDIANTDRFNPEDRKKIEEQIAEYLRENKEHFKDIIDSIFAKQMDSINQLIVSFRNSDYKNCAIILNRNL